jgi:hypothetical protein
MDKVFYSIKIMFKNLINISPLNPDFYSVFLLDALFIFVLIRRGAHKNEPKKSSGPHREKSERFHAHTQRPPDFRAFAHYKPNY